MEEITDHKFKTLIENLPQKIFLKDRNSVYVSCNENYARDLKIEPSEIAGKTDYDFFPKYLAKKYIDDDKNTIKSGETVEFDEIYIKNRQKLIVHSIKIPLRDEQDNITGILGIFWDITRQKKMEYFLRWAQIGELIAHMAHEVNNPLMIISGNAQLSLMEEIPNETVKTSLQIIIEECDRAKNIIQQLLKISRPSKGERKTTDINKCLDAIVTVVENHLKMSDVVIRKDYAEGLPPVVVDEPQMQEIFMNLFSNARDAMMSKSGTVTIKTRQEGKFVRIDFKDTGIGISEENRERILEPFFTTKEKGTGLGLPICYSIIKAHDGELKMESKEGKGTTISILLPFTEAKNHA